MCDSNQKPEIRKGQAPVGLRKSEEQDLTALREQMDRLDEELVALFRRRMELSLLIGRAKASAGRKIRDCSREAQKLCQVKKLAGDDLASYTEALYRELMHLSREYQKADPETTRLDGAADVKKL